jgi:hypothetical protein
MGEHAHQAAVLLAERGETRQGEGLRCDEELRPGQPRWRVQRHGRGLPGRGHHQRVQRLRGLGRLAPEVRGEARDQLPRHQALLGDNHPVGRIGGLLLGLPPHAILAIALLCSAIGRSTEDELGPQTARPWTLRFPLSPPAAIHPLHRIAPPLIHAVLLWCVIRLRPGDAQPEEVKGSG